MTPDRYRKVYRPQSQLEVAQLEETERWFNRILASVGSLQNTVNSNYSSLSGRIEVVAASIPAAGEPEDLGWLNDLRNHLTDIDNPHETSPTNLSNVGFSGSAASEVIGAGDGTTLNFSGTLATVPIMPSTVTLSWTIGGAVQSVAASSTGVVSMTPYVYAVFREDGTWYANFGSGYAPDNATDIEATYSYVTDQQFLIYDSATATFVWRTAMAADIYCAAFDGVLTGAATVQDALDIVDEFDSRYLMLDCSNDPLMASLEIDGNLDLIADAIGENRQLTIQGVEDPSGTVYELRLYLDTDSSGVIETDYYLYVEAPYIEIHATVGVYVAGDTACHIGGSACPIDLLGTYVRMKGTGVHLINTTYLAWASDVFDEFLKLDYDGSDLTLEKYDTDHWDPYALTVGYGGTGACLTAGAIGDVLVADAASTFARLSGNTSATRKYLSQIGDGAGHVTGTTWEEDATAFGIIRVSGQDDVVAAGPTDVLTLAAGSGIVLTTDPATAKVTIEAQLSGSGTSGKLAKWSGTSSLGDSIYSESAGAATIAGDTTVNGDVIIADHEVNPQYFGLNGDNLVLSADHDENSKGTPKISLKIGNKGVIAQWAWYANGTRFGYNTAVADVDALVHLTNTENIPALVLQPKSGQTADIFQVHSASGTVRLSIEPDYDLIVRATASGENPLITVQGWNTGTSAANNLKHYVNTSGHAVNEFDGDQYRILKTGVSGVFAFESASAYGGRWGGLQLGVRSNNFIILADPDGYGNGFQLCQWDGSTFRSMLEYVNTAGGNPPTLTLLGGGGTLVVNGGTGATANVAVAKVGGGTRTLSFTNGIYTGYTDS